MVAHNLITNCGAYLRVGQQHRMGHQWHASALCQVKAGLNIKFFMTQLGLLLIKRFIPSSCLQDGQRTQNDTGQHAFAQHHLLQRLLVDE